MPERSFMSENYIFKEISFPSKDGVHTIYAEIYIPKMTPVGVVQLSHGMIDYVGRYKELADFLTQNGYVFAGHHHLGHGKSAGEDFGIFSEGGDGVQLLLRDMHQMNKYLRNEFPNLPLVLMGHSMGSFVARLYVLKYPHTVKGVIIHGTGGPNPLLPFGKMLTSLIKGINGERHISPLIEKLTFGKYNRRFPKEEGEGAWLTRETELVADRNADPFTSFKFTVSGYSDLLKMVSWSNSKKWFSEYPKDMPTLIISGDMDPVGDYGKGPNYVYKQLKLEGCTYVKLKLYENARHELFNETNRQEVFSYILSWLGSVK